MTNRHGWLSPTEGARHATWIRRSNVPGGSGSRRKRRTSRRQTSRSRKRARKASSKSIGLLAVAVESWICAFMHRSSIPSPNHDTPVLAPMHASRRQQTGSSAHICRRHKQDDDLADLLERAQDIAGLAADVAHAQPRQKYERRRHKRERANARRQPKSDT